MADAAQHNPRTIHLVGASPPVSGVGTAKISLERIVSDHLDEITRLTYRLLGWTNEVEDIVQDVFLSAAQRLDTLREPSSIRAWLFQITINKCRTWRYRQKLRLRFWVKHHWEKENDISSSCNTDACERDIQVRDAVKALPAKYREAVVLRYLEQLPVCEVARMLKVNENTLNVRLLRARTMLRETLEKEK